MRVRQLAGRDFAKSSMVPDAWRENDATELARRERNRAKVRAVVLREARSYGAAPVLIVAQQAVEEAWKAAGALPANVEMAHHNAVAGRDEWRKVRAEIVVGRTLPKPGDAERLAEALTGAAVAQSVARYVLEDALILMRDGSTARGEVLRHPDPVAERVRWQICEGELLQIIGRCRGVARTAENPVDVLVLTDRPIPLAVDELVSWEALEPSPADMMLSAGGVALQRPHDMATAYPALWSTQEAAKKAVQRTRLGTIPLWESLKGKCPQPLSRAAYQRAGVGNWPARAIHDPTVVPDLRAWLEARLGRLNAFTVESATAVEVALPHPMRRASPCL